jgi:hypothetical protein
MLVVDGIGLLRSAPERDRYLPGGIGTGHLQTDVRPKRINQRANQLLRVAWLPDGKSFVVPEQAPSARLEHTLSTGEERQIWGRKSGRTSHGYSGLPDEKVYLAGAGLGGSRIPLCPASKELFRSQEIVPLKHFHSELIYRLSAIRWRP